MLLDRIFDTNVDTTKMFVSMNTKIVKRNYINAEGKSLLYLHATKNSQRVRIPLDIYVPADLWDPKKKLLKGTDLECQDKNLMIGAIQSKINGIKVQYRLSEKQLSLEKFVEEFNNSIPRLDFLAFMDYQINEEKSILAPGTVRRHNAVLNKLREWKGKIYFTEIDDAFFIKFRSQCKKLKNENVTIESNMACIKKFLRAAEKAGIRMAIKSEDIKVGSTNGDRTDLSGLEIHRLFKFFFSEFVNPRHQLATGYFLFACFTGLRISDVQQLRRSQLKENLFSFISIKTEKKQFIRISDKLRSILDHDPRLFVKKVSNEEINRVLKIVATTCGIKKKVSFHVARHSFATNFLRMGGDVQTLQSLLGHSNISETMIYVHIVNAEACEKIKIMDNLF